MAHDAVPPFAMKRFHDRLASHVLDVHDKARDHERHASMTRHNGQPARPHPDQVPDTTFKILATIAAVALVALAGLHGLQGIVHLCAAYCPEIPVPVALFELAGLDGGGGG
ncbi:MAG: hypothetical protein Q6365_009365, partial [Candidatus Sigynarchaeota archaeon]